MLTRTWNYSFHGDPLFFFFYSFFFLHMFIVHFAKSHKNGNIKSKIVSLSLKVSTISNINLQLNQSSEQNEKIKS